MSELKFNENYQQYKKLLHRKKNCFEYSNIQKLIKRLYNII